jgi:hypothetical protein
MVKCGASFEEVAIALQVTVDDVQTHFELHAPIPPMNADPRSASDSELEQLLHDSTELYLQSVLQNNLTAASASLGVRLRTLTEKANRAVDREKHGLNLLEGVEPTVKSMQFWPGPLQSFWRLWADDLLRETEKAKRLGELEEVES